MFYAGICGGGIVWHEYYSTLISLLEDLVNFGPQPGILWKDV